MSPDDSLLFEKDQQSAEQISEGRLFFGGQRREHAALVGEMLRTDSIDEGQARRSECNQHTAPVVLAGYPSDKSGVFQLVQSVRKGARSTHQRLVQLGGRELVGRADTAQAGQDVPGLPGESVRGEDRV